MKHAKKNSLSTLAAGLFAAASFAVATAPAAAQGLPGGGAGLTDKVKEAAAVGVGTAADETAKGADLNTAAAKGGQAALDHSLTGAAPAAEAPAAESAPAAPAAE